MISNYSIRALTQLDLEEIWLYTYKEWGKEQADNYLHSLFSRFDWLSKNSSLGKKRSDVKEGYYSFPERKHLIFYTISKNTIDIIGVPHQSMNVINHVK